MSTSYYLTCSDFDPNTAPTEKERKKAARMEKKLREESLFNQLRPSEKRAAINQKKHERAVKKGHQVTLKSIKEKRQATLANFFVQPKRKSSTVAPADRQSKKKRRPV